MAQSDTPQESFEQFKNWFAYGSRSDMNFKFLKNLSNDDAALFLRQLLQKLGESLDDGQIDRLVQHVVGGQCSLPPCGCWKRRRRGKHTWS